MIDEDYELEFENRCKKQLAGFSFGFSQYLKTKSISDVMQRLFTNLKLELFIWSSKSRSEVSNSLNDKLEPIQIKYNEIKRIDIAETENVETQIKNYIERQEQKTYVYSTVKKVRYNNSPILVSEFGVMWGIALDAGRWAAEKIMVEVVLDFLHKCFDSIDYLSMTQLSVWQEKEKLYNFDIIDEYVKKVFIDLRIPSENVIRKISYQPYEGNEVCASIYFADKNICEELKKLTEQGEGGLIWIEKASIRDMNKDKNVSSVRKMLEACKDESALLVQISPVDGYPIIAVAHKKILQEKHIQCRIDFSGRGEWRLFVGEEDEIRKEVIRLADLCKGTKIREIDLSQKKNLPLLKGLASIDGAVMVDYNGICYGFGVILDGETKIPGDIGRGSRYNSARNYVKWRGGYAVVFSEDEGRGIEVIDKKGNVL